MTDVMSAASGVIMHGIAIGTAGVTVQGNCHATEWHKRWLLHDTSSNPELCSVSSVLMGGQYQLKFTWFLLIMTKVVLLPCFIFIFYIHFFIFIFYSFFLHSRDFFESFFCEA